MDPNANLEQQRRLMLELKEMSEALTAAETKRRMRLLEQLAEEAEAMDKWLTRGGFLPTDWSVVRARMSG